MQVSNIGVTSVILVTFTIAGTMSVCGDDKGDEKIEIFD